MGRPFTGAWIETYFKDVNGDRSFVAPSRGRGLKRSLRDKRLPVWGRPFTGAWIETLSGWLFAIRKDCRPFTGAWIETAPDVSYDSELESRPFTGAWIETLKLYSKSTTRTVAPSRGRGLKHAASADRKAIAGSPLHGGVD